MTDQDYTDTELVELWLARFDPDPNDWSSRDLAKELGQDGIGYQDINRWRKWDSETNWLTKKKRRRLKDALGIPYEKPGGEISPAQWREMSDSVGENGGGESSEGGSQRGAGHG